MSIKINNKFSIEQKVYLTTDSEQLERVITAIIIHPNQSLTYMMGCGTEVSEHYDFEIQEEKQVI